MNYFEQFANKMTLQGFFYVKSYLKGISSFTMQEKNMEKKLEPQSKTNAMISNILFYGCGVVVPVAASVLKIFSDFK